MSQAVILLITGFFLGAVVSLVIVWLFTASKRRRETESQEEKSQIMRQIGEEIADLDTLIAHVRSGSVLKKNFRPKFDTSLETINKILKPSLHIFDPFFVKYVETSLETYQRIAREILGGNVVQSDIVNEDTDDIMTDEMLSAPQAQNESAEEVAVEKKEPVQSAPVILETEKKEIPELVSAQPAEIDTEKTEKTVSQESSQVFDEPKIEKTEEKAMPKIDIRQKSTVTGIEEEVRNAVQKGLGENVDSEADFSMETLMDVDIGKLSLEAMKSRIEDVSIVAPKSEPAESVPEPAKKTETPEIPIVAEVNIALPPAKKETPATPKVSEAPVAATAAFVGKTTIEAPKKPVIFDDDEPATPPTLFEIEPQVTAPEEPKHDDVDKKDLGVTGDDVIDKMDAFFGFKS